MCLYRKGKIKCYYTEEGNQQSLSIQVLLGLSVQPSFLLKEAWGSILSTIRVFIIYNQTRLVGEFLYSQFLDRKVGGQSKIYGWLWGKEGSSFYELSQGRGILVCDLLQEGMRGKRQEGKRGSKQICF
jgi:hypothetical protein